MSKKQANYNGRNLRVILAILCVVALILCGLIIVNIIIKNSSEVANEDEETALYFEGMDEEEYEEAQRIEKFNKMHAEVEKLLEQDPVNVDKINELYNEFIDLAIAEGRTYDAVVYINTRNDDFLSKDLKRAALDAMSALDLSIYTETDRYRLYTSAIELAEMLGDNEALVKYQKLRSTVEEAYWEDYESTKRAENEAGEYDNEEEDVLWEE